MRALIVVGVAASLICSGVWLRGLNDAPVIIKAKVAASEAHGVAVAVQDARRVEHATAASDVAASSEYQRGLDDGKKDLQHALDRRDAVIRLREQQLIAARSGAVSSAPVSSGGRDASAPADFLAAHGDVALRLAAEADDVVRQLQACQVILKSDRTE